MISDNWTREHLAFLAGLLEGEGSFILDRGKWPRIKLKMTDEDVVRKAYELAGTGTMSGPHKVPKADGSGYHKDNWSWRVCNQYECYALMVAILPWMGTRRREQIMSVIKTWQDWRRTNPKVGNPCFSKAVSS